MRSFSQDLYDRLEVACSNCSAESLSLSGGLDSTILGYYLKDRKPKAVSVIANDFEGDDLVYSQLAAKEFGLPLTILKVDSAEILEAIEQTILILQNFNDIEIRNNVVMYLALNWAKKNGFQSLVTGDGADELFAGYGFFLKKNENDLEKELQRVFSVMHFPSKKIGESLGVRVETPFLDDGVISLARKTPGNLKIGLHEGKKYGKFILRKTFEGKIQRRIVWREKSAMQDGAGTNSLPELFDRIIPDESFEQKKKTIEKEDGVIIRTKESMHYFEIFKERFGSPRSKNAVHPCPYCHFDSENSKFCQMCGAFPI